VQFLDLAPARSACWTLLPQWPSKSQAATTWRISRSQQAGRDPSLGDAGLDVVRRSDSYGSGCAKVWSDAICLCYLSRRKRHCLGTRWASGFSGRGESARASPADRGSQRRARELIRKMSRDNPLWGAPRIHGDLLKYRHRTSVRPGGAIHRTQAEAAVETGATFLRITSDHVSIEFLTVPTIPVSVQVLYVFLVSGSRAKDGSCLST